MRPKGTTEQLDARRERALALLSQGQKPSEVAAAVGVNDRSVRRWRDAAGKPKRRASRPAGRPRRLLAQQVRRLERELRRGAFAHGYAGDYWTLDRVGQLIWQLFSVRYHPSGVWHVLRRMGWSCQRLQRRPFGRDDEAVAHWRHYIWSQTKKWRELGATLVFEDEAGFSLVSALKRTWAPRGQTPTVRTSLDHHERLNLLGGLRVTRGQRRVKLMIHSHRRTLCGEEVIAWLIALLGRVRGPIVLVWDQHPIHQRKKVKAFIAAQPRLHVYEFPTGAPELNPVEWIWQQTNDRTASTAPHNRTELRVNVMASVARVRRSPRRLWAGLTGAGLTL